jgi:hypothetical protein
MNSKPWYQSKTLLGIALAILIAAAQILGISPQAIPAQAENALQILTLIYAGYGRLSAKTTIK